MLAPATSMGACVARSCFPTGKLISIGYRSEFQALLRAWQSRSQKRLEEVSLGAESRDSYRKGSRMRLGSDHCENTGPDLAYSSTATHSSLSSLKTGSKMCQPENGLMDRDIYSESESYFPRKQTRSVFSTRARVCFAGRPEFSHREIISQYPTNHPLIQPHRSLQVWILGP